MQHKNEKVIGFKFYLIKTLLSVMRVEHVITHNLQTFFASLRNKYPSISEEQIIDLNRRYNYSEYLDRASIIFDRNFEIQELQDLIKFYNSPLGAKLMSSEIQHPIEEIGRKILIDMEQDFKRIIKNENHKPNTSNKA